RRGLSVRTENEDDAVRKLRRDIAHHVWSELLHNHSWQCAPAAAQTRRETRQAASENRKDIVQAGRFTQGSPGATATVTGGEASPSSSTRSGGCALASRRTCHRSGREFSASRLRG